LTTSAALLALSSGPVTPLRTTPVAGWTHVWFQLAYNASRTIAYPFWLALIVLVDLLVAAAIWKRRLPDEPIRAATGAVLVACAYWVVAGTLVHVQHQFIEAES
jgi:hypothetical protein